MDISVYREVGKHLYSEQSYAQLKFLLLWMKERIDTGDSYQDLQSFHETTKGGYVDWFPQYPFPPPSSTL